MKKLIIIILLSNSLIYAEDPKCTCAALAGFTTGVLADLGSPTPADGTVIVCPLIGLPAEIIEAGAVGLFVGALSYNACKQGEIFEMPPIESLLPTFSDVVVVDQAKIDELYRETGTELVFAEGMGALFPIPDVEELNMQSRAIDWTPVENLGDNMKIDSIATLLWTERLLRKRQNNCNSPEYRRLHKAECNNLASKLNKITNFLRDLKR